MTQEQVIKKLKLYIFLKHKSAKAYAAHIGVSFQYVSMVLKGEREPSNYMLSDIELIKTKVTVYSKIK